MKELESSLRRVTLTLPQSHRQEILNGWWGRGSEEPSGKRGHQRMRWLDDITSGMDKKLGKLWEIVRNRKAKEISKGLRDALNRRKNVQDW